MFFVKFLHVVFMFGSMAVALAGGAMPTLIARSRDVPSIRTAFRAWAALSDAIGPLAGLGGITGLIAAWLFGFDLTRPWLLISYGLVAGSLAFGIGIEARWHGRVYRAALASPDDRPSPELEAALDDRIHLVGYWGLMALVIAVVFDMIVKPFD